MHLTILPYLSYAPCPMSLLCCTCYILLTEESLSLQTLYATHQRLSCCQRLGTMEGQIILSRLCVGPFRIHEAQNPGGQHRSLTAAHCMLRASGATELNKCLKSSRRSYDGLKVCSEIQMVLGPLGGIPLKTPAGLLLSAQLLSSSSSPLARGYCPHPLLYFMILFYIMLRYIVCCIVLYYTLPRYPI